MQLALLMLVALAGLALAAWFVVTQPWVAARRDVRAPDVSAARLEAHVRALSETFVPRDWRHPENLGRAADYIGQELAAAGGTVSEQPVPMDGTEYRNVIATFGPDTPERIVVGAHYDAFGELPAADDNASGVAGLIELARLLGDAPPPCRVELVAYTLEEPKVDGGDGLFRSVGGSAVHAESLRRQGVTLRLMMSLEMIGRFSDEPGSQAYPSPLLRRVYPAAGNFVMVVGRLREGLIARRVKAAMAAASPLPVFSINAPASVGGLDWSDHAAYWARGYPALMITDTALNRNRDYHGPGDTADRLDYARMAMVVQGVHAAVLAEASARTA